MVQEGLLTPSMYVFGVDNVLNKVMCLNPVMCMCMHACTFFYYFDSEKQNK